MYLISRELRGGGSPQMYKSACGSGGGRGEGGKGLGTGHVGTPSTGGFGAVGCWGLELGVLRCRCELLTAQQQRACERVRALLPVGAGFGYPHPVGAAGPR